MSSVLAFRSVVSGILGDWRTGFFGSVGTQEGRANKTVLVVGVLVFRRGGLGWISGW